MNKMQEQLLEFHKKFGVHIQSEPSIPHDGTMRLRFSLIDEELDEMKRAVSLNDLVGAIDGLTDLLYVVMGTAVSMGVDVEPFFDEVHRSNMSKVWPDGTVHYRKDGKVLKPKSYSPANIEGLLLTAKEKTNG